MFHLASLVVLLLVVTFLETAKGGQLSISADAISKSEVYVSWDTIEDEELRDFRLSFTTSGREPWRLLSFFPGLKGFRVMDLEPATVYFFRAQGQIGDEKVTAITHVKTPPYVDSQRTGNLSYVATSSGMKIRWAEAHSSDVLGYVVSYVELDSQNVATGPVVTRSVFGTPELLLEGLKKGTRYKVQVQYRTRYGVGAKSSPLFLGEALPVKPRLVEAPGTKKVLQGSIAFLTCGAVSEPSPTALWRRSGKKVSSNKRRYTEVIERGTTTMKIHRVGMGDKGPYVCIIDNKVAKKVKTRGTMKVYKTPPPGFPEIIRGPMSTTVYKGEDITLTCSAIGKGRISYIWYRNGIIVKESSRILPSNKGSLRILKVDAGDAGEYICEAFNAVGNAYAQPAMVTLSNNTKAKPPTFKESESVFRVSYGGAVNISCEASGYPIPQVKWILENEQTTTTAREGVFVLALTNLQRSGSYQCVAISGNHTVTHNYEVIVDLPDLPQPIIHLAQRLDGGAGFIRWKLPGDEELEQYPGVGGFRVTYIPVDSSGRVLDSAEHALEHTASDRKDLMPYLPGGFRYKVVVQAKGEGGLGPISEPSYIPAVGQPEIIVSPEPLTLPTGNSAIFHCRATGKPVPLLYWTKGRKRINYKDVRLRMTVNNGHTMLRIDDVVPADSGTYTCIAANNILRLSVSKEASLNIIHEEDLPEGFPKIVLGPLQKNISGQDYVECLVDGYPKPNVTWYKDSYLVTDSSRILQKGGRLYFNSMSRSDEGSYQCRATNTYGSVFSSDREVTRKGSNRQSVKFVRVVPGSNVNLTCVGGHKPRPNVRWMYNGEEIENGGSHVLQVVDIRESRNYTCLAMTEKGEFPATFVIVVQGDPRVAQGKPVIVTDTNRVEVRSGLGLNLTCSTGGVPVLYFKWLVDQELIFQDNRGENINSSVLYLTNVRHDKNYTCVAVGARENAEVVFQVVVVGDVNPNKPVIVEHPEDTYAFVNQPATLSCRGEGDPPPIITWYKDGRRLLTSADDPQSRKIILQGGKLFFLSVIHNRDVSDAGVYYCNATNAFGSTISKYSKLQIAAVPKIITHPKPITVQRGDDVNITCSAVGPPEPHITWRLKNEDLQKGVSHTGSSVLVLRSIQKSENYTCVAHNSVGRSQEVFPVWVGGYEAKKHKVKVIKVVPGSFLNLTCMAESMDDTFFSWSTADEDLPVSGPVLTLSNVRRPANYTCVAERPGSRSEATFKIVIESLHALVIGGTEFVEEGETIAITCNATGEYADATEIEWFKDGVPLRNNDVVKMVTVRFREHSLMSSRLTIIHSRMRDAGVYACRAPGRSIIRNIHVHLIRDEKVKKKELFRKIVKGEFLNLTCITPDSRNNMYVWKKNGEYIKGLTKSYHIEEQVQESANYTCISQGVKGVSKATFRVMLEGRQGVTINGTDRVKTGETINISCNATGKLYPPEYVVWFKDEEQLHESDDVYMNVIGSDDFTLFNSLEVRNSEAEDSGTYTCRSSLKDATSFEVKVTKASKEKSHHGAKITSPPRHKNVEDGSVVRFYCSASGSDSLTLHWETGGRRVVSKRRFTVVDTPGASILEIDPVDRDKDQGQVACVAAEGVGPLQTHFARLTVYDHKSVPFDFPAITEHPQLRAVVKGRTTSLQCEALGTKNATIRWYKNKFPLTTGGRFIITPRDQGSELTISSTEKEDETSYQCSVENRAGIAYSKQANLYVRGTRFPPQFTRPSDTKQVRRGDDVTLVCTAVGSPVPYVRWLHNGEHVNEGHAPTERDVIRVTNVQESSDFVCTAENILGKIQYSTRVVVQDPEAVPLAPSRPVISDIKARQVTVTWEDANKEGISTITVFIVHVRHCRNQWHQSTSRDVIVGGTSRHVTIPGLKPGTCYQIRLTAKNEFGSGPDGEPSRKFYTSKEVSRAAPHEVKARLVLDDSGLVSWTEPPAAMDVAALREYRVLYTINPTVPLQFWKNQSIPRDQTSAIIRGLVKYATYTIRIQAVYRDGQKEVSEAIELFVRDPSKDELQLKVSNLEGEILSPSSVKLFWKNPVSVEPTEGYELYIEDSSGYNENIRISGSANSYVLSGLVPGGDYILKLARRTKYGEGPATDPISVKLPSFILEAPSITDLSPVNSTAIIVNWNPPAMEAAIYPGGIIQAYIVYVDNQQRRQTRRYSVEASKRRFTVGGLTPDTRYSVRVAALTDQGDGPGSDPLFVTTNAVDSHAPKLSEVAAVNETALFIRWTHSPEDSDMETKGYFVYIEKVKAGPWDPTVRYIMDVQPSSKKDIVMGNLTPGTKYKVEVAPYSKEGEGAKSKPMTGSTRGEAVTTPFPDFLPRAPFLEEVSPMNATSILVTWWPPEDEMPRAEITGYYVYIERLVGSFWNPESRYQTNIPPEGQLFIISGLKPKSSYRVLVSAYSEHGEGLKSDGLEVELPGLDDNIQPSGKKISKSVSLPKAPTLNEVSAVNATSVRVKWRPDRADIGSSSGNIHGYYLYVELFDKGNWRSEFKFETNALPSSQQLTINGLERNRKYRIRVAGFGPAGEGPQSESMSTETTANAISGGATDRDHQPQGFCQIYLGTACLRFLRNKSIFVTSRFSQTTEEEKIIVAMTILANTLSAKCVNLFLQTACYTTFPPCGATGNVPAPRGICREDCYSMETQCGDELAIARTHANIGQDYLPQCSTLRTSVLSSGGTCIRVGAGLEARRGLDSRGGGLTGNSVPSSPQRLAVNPVSRAPYRVRLIWMPPQQLNGDITGYEVGWSSDAGDTYKKFLPVTQQTFETPALYRGLRYEFEVRAMNQAGMSQPVRAILDIPEGVPTGPPRNLETSTNATTIKLTWDPPSRDKANGRISGYVVKTTLPESPGSEQLFQTSHPGLIVGNVEARTVYSFSVAAQTRQGQGPWSNTIVTIPR